jgi:hypothetical protein
MRQQLARMAVVSALLVSAIAPVGGQQPDWQSLIVSSGSEAELERGALINALQLLPRLPVRVAVLDAAEAKPQVRERLLRLDAFIVKGSAVEYVVKQSALFRGAVTGSSVHTHAVAAVIWHEMAHVDGAHEREARAREEALWTSYIRDQRLDKVTALRYLSALKRRPDNHSLASR